MAMRIQRAEVKRSTLTRRKLLLVFVSILLDLHKVWKKSAKIITKIHQSEFFVQGFLLHEWVQLGRYLRGRIMILPFMPPETIYPHYQREADQGGGSCPAKRLAREYKATKEKLEQEQRLEKGCGKVIWNYPHTTEGGDPVDESRRGVPRSSKLQSMLV
ncbi:UNVERIFIED_CONTAM: hypothetical protein Slati_2086500 [Sesamum latifolium]|uniref:Uncharacterized protein n=1 Tax=Sesamum latifolium TaxID=2727402 RepID=A0AAW2WQ30_9LAMI